MATPMHVRYVQIHVKYRSAKYTLGPGLGPGGAGGDGRLCATPQRAPRAENVTMLSTSRSDSSRAASSHDIPSLHSLMHSLHVTASRREHVGSAGCKCRHIWKRAAKRGLLPLHRRLPCSCHFRRGLRQIALLILQVAETAVQRGRRVGRRP